MCLRTSKKQFYTNENDELDKKRFYWERIDSLGAKNPFFHALKKRALRPNVVEENTIFNQGSEKHF